MNQKAKLYMLIFNGIAAIVLFFISFYLFFNVKTLLEHIVLCSCMIINTISFNICSNEFKQFL